MTMQKRTIARLVAIALVASAGTGYAQQSNNEEEPQQQATRQAQAVSRAVYEVIEKARTFLDDEEFSEAVDLLTSQLEKTSLTEYERANLYQVLGFAHHSADETKAAISAFAAILDIEGIEESMRKNTLYTLAQLLAMEERHDESLARLSEWFTLELKPAPDAHIFYAQTLYQLGRNSEMIEPIETALAIAQERNIEAKENWYALLSFAYFQQENYAKIRDINELLLEKWPKKRYWLYLANAYRELNDEVRFFSSYEAMYLQGHLESESELVTMAQLYLQQEVPIKAAKLLETEMESGRLSKSAKNYRLQSQAWYLAREDEESIEPLETAARMEEDGNLYIRLANAYLSLGRAADCVAAASAGFERGDLKNPDHAQMTLGMCLYNAHEYGDAMRAFRRAAGTPRSATVANQWLDIVRLEIRRQEEIAMAEALAVKRYQELEARRAELEST
ncbi:MAG: hypothetical protein OER91_08880 [Gammaproteobacteria bacterium]|nr:hypothetical protein [Gammaproteobacteria bacterium]